MEEILIKDSLKLTKKEEARGVVHIALNGYLDTYNAPDFKSFINNLIDSGIDGLIFDFGGLSYISSTGIGAFTAFQKRLKQMEKAMVLFNLQKKVIEVFEILGFTAFFTITKTRDEALLMTTEKGRGTGKKKTFPVVFACPHCSKKLKAPEPGDFKCSGCGGTVRVNEDGSAEKGG